jgi:hypothetical protein
LSGSARQELRVLLPGISIWAAGSGVARSRKSVDGVSLLHSFGELRQALAQWRATHGTRLTLRTLHATTRRTANHILETIANL